MNRENDTCVQRSIFRFYYRYSMSPKKINKKYSCDSLSEKGIGPEQVRKFKQYLVFRLERIAEMMELLLSVHADWAVTERRDFIQIETVSFDFNKAVDLLQVHGFDNREYSLEVEYTRKWGVL